MDTCHLNTAAREGNCFSFTLCTMTNGSVLFQHVGVPITSLLRQSYAGANLLFYFRFAARPNLEAEAADQAQSPHHRPLHSDFENSAQDAERLMESVVKVRLRRCALDDLQPQASPSYRPLGSPVRGRLVGECRGLEP